MVSKAKEIYDSLVSEFPGAMQAISELSRNDQGGKDFIRCDAKAFNFDTLLNFGGIKCQKEKSPDALFLHNDILYFVEFKEGKHERADVRQKIHEGVITLFQYSTARGIADRESFFGIELKYAVIKRGSAAGTQSFLLTLEKSQDIFSLKNIEGLLVRETTVRWHPDSIFKLLKKISDGAINQIDFVSADQTSVQVCT
jgi:hypothetical protein